MKKVTQVFIAVGIRGMHRSNGWAIGMGERSTGTGT